jgi:glutaredoxin
MLTVYSKPQCPQCVTAKTELKKHGITFSEVEVDYGQTTTNSTIARTEFMEKFPGVRSLPHIVSDDTSIGSLPQLLDWLKK